MSALVAIFAIITSHSWAFDPSHEVVGQIYLSIPFGTATKQEATPRLGFRVAYGDGPTFADRNARVPYNLLDWRSNFDGQTTLLLNGVDVVQLSHSLHAAEDEELGTSGKIVLGVLLAGAVGGLVYLAVHTKNCLDDLRSC
jgi:hypothetical protein